MDQTAADRERAIDLRAMKRRATGLLVLATAIYLWAKIAGDRTGVLGYIEATAEAAMVGGIADWFAVTALFRHPLGLPIPHTAIVEKRKDQIGRSLGDFVQDNFLDRDTVLDRIEKAEPAAKLGAWLSVPANADLAANQIGAVLKAGTEILRDDEVRTAIESIVVTRVEDTPVAPMVGRAVDFAIDGDHHHAVVDAVLNGLGQMLHDNATVLRDRLSTESPWWVPEPLDDRVFERLFDAMQRFVAELAGNRDHELRRNVNARIASLAADLRESPELAQRGEELKAELLHHPQFREWTGGLWEDLKRSLVEAVDDDQSTFSLRLREAVLSAGRSLTDDDDLQRKVDGWIAAIAGYVTDQSSGEAADFIASTIERWDAKDTSERIELQVGRDLQFIRINGTLVGGLAGLLIHLISELAL